MDDELAKWVVILMSFGAIAVPILKPEYGAVGIVVAILTAGLMISYAIGDKRK